MKNMTAMNAKRKQSGFTIIELVVVILLLGILTATALPRFMDVTDEAHTAVVDALEGGLATGIALYRAQWVAEGQPLSSAVSEFNLYASAAGYPKDDAAVFDTGNCKVIYDNVLQAGGRLEAASIVTANAATDAAVETAIEAIATTADIAARLVQAATLADSTTCNYYYVGQYRSGTTGTGNDRDIPVISYDFTTGAISRSTFTLEN